MPITVHLSENGNENITRQFAPGSKIEIYGTVYGKILPSPFQFVRVEVLQGRSTLSFEESRTGLLGGYSYEFQAPSSSVALTLQVSTTFPLGAVETKEVPVAVGNAQAGDLPVVPQEENIFTSLDTVLKLLPFVIGILIVLFIYNQTKRR